MMSKLITYIVECFGFTNLADLGQSVIHFKTGLLSIFKIGLILGTVSSYIEKFIGIEPVAFVAFIVLIVLEFITGIKASIEEGSKIESRKFGRMIIKLAVYTITLGLLNTFQDHLQAPIILGYTFDIYGWIFKVVMNMVIVQLFISVLENLSRLGYMETLLILKVIKKRFNKWFDL